MNETSIALYCITFNSPSITLKYISTFWTELNYFAVDKPRLRDGGTTWRIQQHSGTSHYITSFSDCFTFTSKMSSTLIFHFLSLFHFLFVHEGWKSFSNTWRILRHSGNLKNVLFFKFKFSWWYVRLYDSFLYLIYVKFIQFFWTWFGCWIYFFDFLIYQFSVFRDTRKAFVRHTYYNRAQTNPSFLLSLPPLIFKNEINSRLRIS